MHALSYLTLYTVSINMIIYIRDYNGYVAFLILIGSWVTDAMAYFTGRLFGKHKLAPTVSPKKTRTVFLPG